MCKFKIAVFLWGLSQKANIDVTIKIIWYKLSLIIKFIKN